MIQRIQSLYLLLTAVLLSALYSLPLATAPKTNDGVFSDGIFDVHDNNLLLIALSIVVLISCVSIFLYKNRVLQINISRLNLILVAGFAGFVSALFMKEETASFGIGLIVPLAAIIMIYMAIRGIQSDEKLIKDSDRLR